MNDSKYTIIVESKVESPRKINRARFAELIDGYFRHEEIKSLAYNLPIDKENIPGDTKKAIAEALVEMCANQGHLQELWKLCRQQRSHADWESVLESESEAVNVKQIKAKNQQLETALANADAKTNQLEQKTSHLTAQLDRSKKLLWVIGAVAAIALLAAVIIIVPGLMNGREPDTNTAEALSTANPMIGMLAQTSDPIPANVKERFDFETVTPGEAVVGWTLSTCTNPDVAECSWLNADDRLSFAQTGFSSENSLQVEASLVNAYQTYSIEHCFDPTLLDGISATVYVPTSETNGQTLAATSLYLQVRPRDDNATKPWPISELELDETMQPGWYQISVDLSQVADESREPYNTLLVDCVQIVFVLPSTSQNEEVTFFIDDITLYRDMSSHALSENIPPRGLMAEETFVTAPAGEGIIFDFEDGRIDNNIWSASDSQEEKQLFISRDRAYDGVYSMAFNTHLVEREGNSGGNTFCITLDGNQPSENLSLQNRIVISRLYVPEDTPDNLGVQYHLSGQYLWPSWAYDSIKRGQWNTFVWYTADSPDQFEEGSDLRFCLYLSDRDIGDKNEYPEEGQEEATFYLDSIELIPYHFVHFGDPRTLDPVDFYDFDTDEVPQQLTSGAQIDNMTSNVQLQTDNYTIYALQLDLNLPPVQTEDATDGSMASVQLDTDNEPVEAVLAMINIPEEPGGTLLFTFAGTLSNGDVISQTFLVSAGNWTPIFWPTRNNDFDAVSETPDMEELTLYITSQEAYQGPVFIDYLATYRYLPIDQ